MAQPAHGAMPAGVPTGAGGVAEVVVALDEAGFKVASLDLQSPTLDDVFLKKTGSHLEGAEPEAA